MTVVSGVAAQVVQPASLMRPVSSQSPEGSSNRFRHNVTSSVQQTPHVICSVFHINRTFCFLMSLMWEESDYWQVKIRLIKVLEVLFCWGSETGSVWCRKEQPFPQDTHTINQVNRRKSILEKHIDSSIKVPTVKSNSVWFHWKHFTGFTFQLCLWFSCFQLKVIYLSRTSTESADSAGGKSFILMWSVCRLTAELSRLLRWHSISESLRSFCHKV